MVGPSLLESSQLVPLFLSLLGYSAPPFLPWEDTPPCPTRRKQHFLTPFPSIQLTSSASYLSSRGQVILFSCQKE